MKIICLTLVVLANVLYSLNAHANPLDNVPIPLSMRASLTTSGVGLSELSAISGTMVDLQGRFQSLTIARLSADGSLKLQCLGASDSHDHGTE